MHHCDQLVDIFNQAFSDGYNTRLVKGGKEPEYLPADDDCHYHRIIFTRDYFASALHEIAHWCIAGEQRRQQHDYGYWYAPDGRNIQQQQQFEQVEVKPQALEWLFSTAAKTPFRVSADNLDSALGASDTFKASIVEQVHHYCEQGMGERPAKFIQALSVFYQADEVYETQQYRLSCL